MKNGFLLFLLFVPCFLIAQDNPFMQMAGRKYADYTEDLYNECLRISILDTIEARNVINQIEEVAHKTGSIEWTLQAAFFELRLLKRKFVLYGNDYISVEELIKMSFQLLEKAKKANIPQLELQLRQDIIDYYWSFLKNCELAFEQFTIQDERLNNISSDDVPEKALYYHKIADAYYYFKEYPKAIIYFNKVLEEKDNIRSTYSKQHARNGLGLSYRYGYNDLDCSDSCFTSMKDIVFDPENKVISGLWNGIAEGNIGYNMLLRGEYGKAIPLLKSSVEKMFDYKDYGYTAQPAINLAKIYIKTDNMAEAKHYIDLAKDCHSKDPRDGVLINIYEVMSKYYTASGNKKMSIAYMDSMLIALKQYEEQFNSILLLRMEQKESVKQQQELVQGKEKLQQSQIRLLILSVSFIIIVGLLGIISLQYRIKNAAYRELVRKSQEWAQNYKEEIKTEYSISEVDQQLFEQLQQMFQLEHLFREPTISVDDIAQRMKVNRTYLSRAVNHCTGKNFNVYINEYRIREAVRLMSNNFHKLSLEGLAFEVGFNDRKTFYTAFRKMTGLSPSEFRSNMREV